MKDRYDRTKVVLRHLPPTLSHSVLTEQIDSRFSGRYKWLSFLQGKNSLKHQKYSRAYIDFRRAEDVVEFAEFFDGHVFVNEKGTQLKAIVEYAPSQRVPKSWSKKDGREGTISKDPEYLEFLEILAKPVENLPSAEVQLEKREAERAGAPKEALIVTPLMDFVRQRRAAKSGSQRSSSNGKPSRRTIGASPGTSRSAPTKRGSEKRRASTSMYVMRDSTKNGIGKDKPAYILVPRHEDHPPMDRSVSVATESGAEIIADERGASGTVDLGKKKVILLKGKEREGSQSYTGVSQQRNVTASVRNSGGSPAFKQGQRSEVGGKIIRSILLNKEPRQSQPSTAVQSEQQIQNLPSEKEKRPPRSSNIRSALRDNLSSVSHPACGADFDCKRTVDVIGSDPHGSGFINDKRTKNKDRPDRTVWIHRRSDGFHGNDDTLSLSESLENMSIPHHTPATGTSKLGDDISGNHRNPSSSHVDMRVDQPNSSRSGEVKTIGSIRSSSMENGSHRYGGRRGPAQGMKDVDGSLYLSEGKPTKRGGATGYGSHEKQVWVQKSGSGT